MAWVAVDRAVRAVEELGRDGPVDRWRPLRDEIKGDVLAHGVDDRGRFVQYYGSSELDASLLIIPQVGLLPASDERVVRTVEAIQEELTVDGFVQRYRSREQFDGLPPGEGTFLLATFWLADVLAMMGRTDGAVARQLPPGLLLPRRGGRRIPRAGGGCGTRTRRRSGRRSRR
jgi:GH15 family glucan-1,4-alpha-glucosidase